MKLTDAIVTIILDSMLLSVFVFMLWIIVFMIHKIIECLKSGVLL